MLRRRTWGEKISTPALKDNIISLHIYDQFSVNVGSLTPARKERVYTIQKIKGLGLGTRWRGAFMWSWEEFNSWANSCGDELPLKAAALVHLLQVICCHHTNCKGEVDAMEINKIMTQTLSIALASACLLLQNLSYPLQCTKLYKKEKKFWENGPFNIALDYVKKIPS